jgi:hypothetical protein
MPPSNIENYLGACFVKVLHRPEGKESQALSLMLGFRVTYFFLFQLLYQ